ncbi:MAG: DUF1318 domain-containing protein [Leptospiraceae bacterium]|nr:DUF1318 domain-containing protein [Leptospiraceae bacterium]MCK6379899.1 DUF1318 domain-containing protein [Leptospiraceae bacterium]NUM40129.1 DUF1318 domain-containing protein [Leptospiraceae bacterium]
MKNNTILLFIILLGVIFSLGCLSLKPPPITFTQTQTSAEKQMVGEDKELEKNGWLIASIKTSSSGSETWQKESSGDEFSDPEYMISLRTIAYFTGELKKYKRHGILGEGLDGSVRRNPLVKESKFYADYSTAEMVKRIDEVVKIINEAREKVVNFRIEQEKKKNISPKEILVLKENLSLTYYREITPGEYYESAKGKWSKKE